MDTLQERLYNYILDPKNPRHNFLLGQAYEAQYQTASAAGYYLRAVEFSRDKLLQYEAILRMALCFTGQGNRVFTVTGLLMRAITLLPQRPEAYFLLSRTYEHNRDWHEAYTWAMMGEPYAGNQMLEPLSSYVEYPGDFCFQYERAVAGWWIGLHDESLHIFRELRDNSTLDPLHATSVRDNLSRLDNSWKPPMLYQESDYERLRHKFPGAQSIERNYSQCYQDLFVLTMTRGKRDGVFLEIGHGQPYYGSNTALLERLGWEGISVDISPGWSAKFKNERKTPAICGDASTMDFIKVLSRFGRSEIDYLQIDCDPAQTSLQVLFNIPFHKYKFKVITFEHDHYQDESKTVRDRSRQYLRSLGYYLLVNDVAMNEFDSFEDWWVNLSFLDTKGLDLVKDILAHSNRDPNEISRIMFNLNF